jgi:hypothetical protein
MHLVKVIYREAKPIDIYGHREYVTDGGLWRRSWTLAPLPPRGHCNTTLRTSHLEAKAERDLRYLPSFLHSVSSF